jgi:hypothetical protein
MSHGMTVGRAFLLCSALCGCGGESATSPSPTTPSPPASPIYPVRVEPTNRLTFGPADATPAGTSFHISIVVKSDATAFRLHRCGEPCNTATTVDVRAPETYTVGENVVWRVDVAGRYYMWAQDVRTSSSIRAASDEVRASKLRMVFDSGAVIDSWYTIP